METVGTSNGFCAHTASLFQFFGVILLIFKIIIPILLIIFGMLDLGKAVIATDSKQIKESVNRLVKRAVISVIIFFIPTIVTALFSLIKGFQDNKADFNVCRTCVINPNGSNGDKTGCKDYIAKYDE